MTTGQIMQQYFVKIKSITQINPDVFQIVTEKPGMFRFIPGQATEVSINKEGWENTTKPFSFTCLPENPYLEFTIKTYPVHQGVTNQVLKLKKGDELIIHDVYGAIRYCGEGTFIAGGAGITPFISIFRYLHSKNDVGNNILLFANKKKTDIILEEEFKSILGNNFINVLSDEKAEGYASGFVTEKLIRKKNAGLHKLFYVCGPPPMVESMNNQLARMGISKNSIVKEAL